MSRPIRDSETQTAELDSEPSISPGSIDLPEPPESQWIRSQLPLLYKVLDQLDGMELPPHQRVRALRNIRRPLLGMVRALSYLDDLESDPKVSALSPSPTPAQRLLERMCRNLDHLLLSLDRRRFRDGPADEADRHWTIRQLFRFLGHQVEYGIVGGLPWPPGTWQRLHDLFEYLIERGDLELGTDIWRRGGGFDPETAYKRLLLIGLCPQLGGARRLERQNAGDLMRWAGQTRLVEPAGRLGEYGLLVVETSQDAPPRFREQPANDPWRGWVLEPPAEFLAVAGIRRSSLSLVDPYDDTRALLGRRQ